MMIRSEGNRYDIKFYMMDVEFPYFGVRFSVFINGSDRVLRRRSAAAEAAEIVSPEDRRCCQSPTIR